MPSSSPSSSSRPVTEPTAGPARGLNPGHQAALDSYLGSVRRVSEEFLDAYRTQTEALRTATEEIHAMMADKDWPDKARAALAAAEADGRDAAPPSASRDRTRSGRSASDFFNERPGD